jgi:rod shape-determining protein MreC
VHDTRRTRVVLAILLAAALALIAVDYLGGSASLRSMGGAVFGVVERATSSVVRPIAGFVARGAGPAGSSARMQALERKLIRLKAELSSERLNRRQYAQLATLLRLPRPGHYRIVAANVIGVGQGYEKDVTINAGSTDGVQPQETVFNASGLVGTVTSVSPWTCTVRLATAPTAVAGVRVAGTGQMGWVTGAGANSSGPGLLRLHVLDASAAIAPGQQLVTSASVGDRPYVAGVPVGEVTRLETSRGLIGTALVRPYVDFGALDVVAVVMTSGRSSPRAGG